MGTYVVFFKPPDEKWEQMKAVWDACEKAGIDPPDEVTDFFDGEPPDEEGVRSNGEEHESVEEWNDAHSSGYKVNVTKLPKDVRYIIFKNSW